MESAPKIIHLARARSEHELTQANDTFERLRIQHENAGVLYRAAEHTFLGLRTYIFHSENFSKLPEQRQYLLRLQYQSALAHLNKMLDALSKTEDAFLDAKKQADTALQVVKNIDGVPE
jgi:hypothetical protein